MIYLLISHVPLGVAGAKDRYRVGDLFLQDLSAQARAIQAVGGTLLVATPLAQNLNAMAGGSFNTLEFTPADHGFEYIPLPKSISLKEYLKVRGTLKGALRAAVARADIIQMDYGGHPFMLGQVAWPFATELKKKRIWLFDGADPFPRLELEASREPNPLKRFAKKVATRKKIDFCRDAIQQAELVFTHNAAVVERFKDVWNDRCHAFDRSFVTDEVLISDLKSQTSHLLESRPLRLVSAGRQIRIKGTDQVIETVGKLRDRGIRVELNVMGDGDDLPAFKKLADDLNLGDRVHFGGTVPYGKPLFDEWAKADIMMVTNLTAEISRNVLLGVARGLPLVTYENPGTDTLLRENNAAIIVPKGDVSALAETLAMLGENRSKLVELAESGLKLARVKTLDATHRARAELAASLFVAPSPFGRGLR